MGDGVYFWQDAPARAWEWAEAHHGDDAAVIHSLIRLDGCLDLLDISWEQSLRDTFTRLQALSVGTHQSLPRQTPESLAHPLDRTVLNFAVVQFANAGASIRTIRAAFQEGAPIYPESHLFSRSHVQVAVRDPALIVRSWRARRQ